MGRHEKKNENWFYGILFWAMVAILAAAVIAATLYFPFLNSTGPMDFSPK